MRRASDTDAAGRRLAVAGVRAARAWRLVREMHGLARGDVSWAKMCMGCRAAMAVRGRNA